MLHKDKGLVVYVDCQPSEQLDYDDITACLICLICLAPEVFNGYEQYKDTPAADRLSVAEAIAKQIHSYENIYCVGSEAKFSAIESAGNKYLNHILPRLREDVVKKYKYGYRVYGKKLNSKVATFVPWMSYL